MPSKPQGRDTVTTGEFVQNLAESGLFDASDVLPASGQLAAPDGTSAAQELVAAGKLTEYQADAVLARRFGDLRIGNYEILDKLGAGGMGTVFKARHRRMKRVVALKVLSREVAGSGKFADRFQREVETIARLSHPNIVMAFDADECEAGPFLVMEFVNGRDLASEVEKAGPLSAADAVDRILQAARGLEYAHGQGIIHRDIKPGNILRDVDGVVKVADLGLARLNTPDGGSGENTSLTQAGTIVGTAEYMPPEQASESGQVDHRSDIYSLGCTLYFLLIGRPPYQAGSIVSMLLKHRDAPIPDLRAARPDIPPELETIFQRMVAKIPEDRYQTMTVVVKALEQVQQLIGRAGAATGGLSSRPTAPAGRPDGTAVFDAAPAGALRDDSGFEVSSAVVPERTPSQAEPTARLTVVLVEPSRTQAGIIRRYLQQLGMDAVHATGSGREALEVAKRERAGVIVSSMHLADMTGVQLARALLDDPGCAGIGFVLATSETDTQEHGAVPASPRVVLMPKPFDLQRLAQSINSVAR
jgi:serine/threonine-protein kinase